MTKKIELGQFFTNKNVWLQPQIIDFILSTGIKKALDPFAGGGDIFKALKDIGFSQFQGLDIDNTLQWEENDSLRNIPKGDAIIVTNPPYLAKNSAKRKRLSAYDYFSTNTYADLYQIGLEKCLQSHSYVVAIIPETFILTELFTDRLHSVTILEENPFEDTEFPVCVVCFVPETAKETLVYKNSTYVTTLQELKNKQLKPLKNIEMIFNDVGGNIGLRGVDGVSGKETIKFCLPNELNYSPDKIKHSSRAITIINVEVPSGIHIKEVINKANEILHTYREETNDILMAAFKGNTKEKKRRRRIDFQTARAILEESINQLNQSEGTCHQLTLDL